jgi:hypothetical protein
MASAGVTTVVVVAAASKVAARAPRVTVHPVLTAMKVAVRAAVVVVGTGAVAAVVVVRAAAKAVARVARRAPDRAFSPVSHRFFKASAPAGAFFLDARPVLGSNCSCSFSSSHGRSHRQWR